MNANDIVLDPLAEAANALPKWAVTLGLNHFSASQAIINDGKWIFQYGLLTQSQRRDLLKPNSAMMAGVCVNNVLQDYYSDIIWNFGPHGKLTPTDNFLKGRNKDEIKQKHLNHFKEFQAPSDKEQLKKDKYEDEISTVVNNGFQALEKIGVAEASFITAERQISLQHPALSIPIVGRTDAELQNSKDGIPFAILEFKTSWSKLGKAKKDGERSFILSTPPATPSFNHLMQCSFYAAAYDYQVPIKLIYLTAKGFEIYDSNNCAALTVVELKKSFEKMMKILKRRQRLLEMFEDLPKELLLTNFADLVDPQWHHPYAWYGIDSDVMKMAKQLFGEEYDA